MLSDSYRASPEVLLQELDKVASGDCPLDDKEEWESEDDFHSCPVCWSRECYNTISSYVREFHEQLVKLDLQDRARKNNEDKES